tara:strand:+ start:309 stop:650 length:342 start_codon:yes stop_codon:yes gene_type:complete
MKKIIMLLILLPNLIFASFPLEKSVSDTLRKDGKIYIKIVSEAEKSIHNNNLENKLNSTENKVVIIKNTKRKRTNTLLGFFGGALILAGVLAVVFVFLIAKLIIDSLIAFGNG